MMNTKNKTAEDMIDRLPHLKGKSKVKFYQNKNISYAEMYY